MKVTPTKKLHFEFAHFPDADGKMIEVKYRFVMSMAKNFSELKGSLEKEIMLVEGIDFFQPVGRYSAEVVVAKTYNPDDVIKRLTEVLEPLMSDIIWT